MFYYLSGNLVHLEDAFAALDCGGVAYKLTVSRTTAEALGMPDESKKVKLFTDMQVRDDGVELFGFISEEEMRAFKLLISVSGVGPKAAMAILSLFTPDKLALAVSSEDSRAIARANGVGPKTAARVVLELKDKFGGFGTGSAGVGTVPSSIPVMTDGKIGEAMEALSVLGYGRAEVAAAVRNLDVAGMTVEEIITAALKYFAK